MKGKRTLTGSLLVLLLLALAVGPGRAQGPEPQGDVSIQAALGTAFTYQGRLTDGGSPADGEYDLRFRLFNAASGGSQVGSTVTRGNVDVSDGVFTVQLDFGGGPFRGQARWLEIGVRPGASTGSYTSLTPRQELTAAPYALYARRIPLDGSGSATTASHSDHDHWGQTWSGSGTGLALAGGTMGLGAGAQTYGVYGHAIAASGNTYGVYGESESTSGAGVYGEASADSGMTYGVYGESASESGRGVYGWATADSGETYGVQGLSESADGRGVYGYARADSGHTSGVYGESESANGRGVYGEATADSGYTYGVLGWSDSTDGTGVGGYASADSGMTYGVYGKSEGTHGRGVYGLAGAYSGEAYGVYGRSNSTEGAGVVASGWYTGADLILQANAPTTTGDDGRIHSAPEYPSSDIILVTNDTVRIDLDADGDDEDADFEIYDNDMNRIFDVDESGDVDIAGQLTKGSGAFKIDHPLDPENQYLYHSFVESPDMMNIYNGNVTTDDDGYATVTLPDYFEALNKDYRYQLTVIGTFAQVIIAREIEDNQFVIQTDRANVKVSWQVTGIRHDPYAEVNRIVVEQDKPVEERGTYLHPQVWGMPETTGPGCEEVQSEGLER
jgi:hypothetical protein